MMIIEVTAHQIFHNVHIIRGVAPFHTQALELHALQVRIKLELALQGKQGA